MAIHAPLFAAAKTRVEMVPGEHPAGVTGPPRPVLTLSHNDVITIEGTPAELRALAARITAVATAAASRMENTDASATPSH